MRFKNFKIWRGRLPHWRADDVTYYVTFRHRRPLEEWERQILLTELLKSEGKILSFLILCVLPEATEMLFQEHIKPLELAKVVEHAKRKAGKAILKKTGERFPPFWEESYDRIVRDEAELEERFIAILDSPASLELCGAKGDYDGLWARD